MEEIKEHKIPNATDLMEISNNGSLIHRIVKKMTDEAEAGYVNAVFDEEREIEFIQEMTDYFESKGYRVSISDVDAEISWG